MSGNIDLLLTGFVCALAILTGICFLPVARAERQDEFFDKIEDPGLSLEEAEAVLRNVTNPNEVELCKFRVSRILAYKDGPCSLENFYGPLDYDQCWIWYSGVQSFLRYWVPKKMKTCAGEFALVLKKAVADENEEIFKNIPSNHKFLTTEETYKKKKYSDADERKIEEEEKYLSNCFRLLDKLSEPMQFDGWKAVASSGERKFIKTWHKLVKKCKRYTKSYCGLTTWGRCAIYEEDPKNGLRQKIMRSIGDVIIAILKPRDPASYANNDHFI